MNFNVNFTRFKEVFRAALEIIILWEVNYRIFLFLKGTKAYYLLRGIIFLVIALLVFQLLNLPVLTRLLTYLFAFFLILVVIIFQPELREGLIHLGKRHIFYIQPKKEDIEKTLKEIVAALGVLSRKRIGALIALEREMELNKYVECGVILDAALTSELLQSIFYPLAPLHDGGVIIKDIRVVAACCLFPLSDNPNLEKTLGMRHRAAIGLSENSDALLIVVSEENGSISLAINGQLTRSLTLKEMLTILKGQLAKNS